MKKALLFVSFLALLGGILYFAQNQNGNLASQYFGPSVYLEGSSNAFPVGTPINTENAITATIPGFTLNRSLMNPFATYQGYYTSGIGGEKYGVQVKASNRGVLDSVREAYVVKMVGTPNTFSGSETLSVYQGAHVIIQNGIFSNFTSRPTTAVLWMTEFGYVRIFQDTIGVKYTPSDLQKVNWDKVHNDLLALADEYLKKYPALPASEYSKFGQRAAKIMKNFDLTKLPEVTKK